MSVVNIGDLVHLGLAQKGGVGFKGKVINLIGDRVVVESLNPSKFGNRTFSGPVANVTHLADISAN